MKATIVWLALLFAFASPTLPLSLTPTLPLEPKSLPHQSRFPPLRAFTVCIDPGHPSEVNSGKSVQNGATETHIDWVVALKLRKCLVDLRYTVVMTKSFEDELVKNKDRAIKANEANADLAVRLHCDSSPDSGYALYYPDRQGTAQGKTGPSADVMSQSKSAAELLHKGMVTVLAGKLKNGGVRGDSKTLVGSKQGALTGSIFSRVPVVTIEMVVLSNAADAAFIKTEAGQQQMADAIAAGVQLCEKAR
jgi:N-acetylmuramoyl-L-alanine amidase